jgi:glutaredoxin-like YruB-family protein
LRAGEKGTESIYGNNISNFCSEVKEGAMPVKFLLAVLTLIFFATPASAEMYRWVDANGVVTFRDTPPPRTAKKSSKVKVYSDSDFDAAPDQESTPAKPSPKRAAAPEAQGEHAAAKNQRFNGTVEIYVTDWCGYCKQAQAYMKRKGIPYVAYNIEKDSAANKRHEELGGRGVPLIIIGSNKMSGFSAEALEYYLDHSK